jgi:hypothetical protein
MHRNRIPVGWPELIVILVSATGTVLVLQRPWGQAVPLYLLMALPGLHGLLTGRAALDDYRQAQSDQNRLIVELISASLLGLATLVMLLRASALLVFWIGAVLGAIATFPLVITAAVGAIKAARQRCDRRRRIIGLLLQTFAFLTYSGVALWLSFLVVLGLAGESYMGS